MGKKKKQKVKVIYRDVVNLESLPPQSKPLGNTVNSSGEPQLGGVGDFLSGLRDAMNQATEGKINGKAIEPPPTAPGIDPLDPNVQKESVGRLVKLFKALGEKPEPILELFSRLEIPWEVIENVPGDPTYDTIVIRVSDLEAGEQRNQSQGSLAQRVYGDTIGQAMSPNRSGDPEAGPETNPEPTNVRHADEVESYLDNEPFEHDAVQLQCDTGVPPDLDDNDSEDYVIEDDPYDLRKVQG